MTEAEAEGAGVRERNVRVSKAAAAMVMAVWTMSAVAKMAARAKAVTKVVRDAVAMAETKVAVAAG